MEIKNDQSFGIVPVFKDIAGNFLFCLVLHAGGHWGFPKGHADENEAEQATALRELKEETGILNVDISNQQFFTEKYSFEIDNIHYDKVVKYFLGIVSSIDTQTQKEFKEEIPELKWLDYKEAKDILTFSNNKEILDQAFQYLNTSKKY